MKDSPLPLPKALNRYGQGNGEKVKEEIVHREEKDILDLHHRA